MMRIAYSFLISAAMLASPALADVISLRADVWCPFNCEPDAERPGYIIEIAKAALEKAGHQVDYQALNWARAIVETREGKYVGIVGSAHSDAPDFVFPKNALGRTKNCFYTKTDSKWEYKGLKSLDEVSLGVIKDYTYGEPVDDYIKQHLKNQKRVDVVAGEIPLELNIRKVMKGRIGTFMEEDSVLRSHFFRKNEKMEGMKNVGCIKEDEIYVAFGPKNPKATQYAKIVSDHVQAMRKDGSLKKLLDQYGLVDWEKK